MVTWTDVLLSLSDCGDWDCWLVLLHVALMKAQSGYPQLLSDMWIWSFYRPSSNEAQNSVVYNHCKASNHSFKPEEAIILDKEARWFRRGVREANWEWVEQPALNKKGGSVFSCRTHGMKRSEVFPAVYHVTNQRLMKSGVSRRNVAKWVAKF